MINVHSIGKRFGPRIAVNDFSCVADDGDILGLLGPNGAGKTTVMKIMMNLIRPDIGYVLFDGLTVGNADACQTGYLSEDRTLYHNVRINEMLLFLASMKNGDTERAEKELDRWLIRFDLIDLKNTTVESLSNGMTQKVQFIAAILHDPRFVFLDEPFSGLDAVGADLTSRAILDLAGRGKTVVLATHSIEIAERLCTRVIIMDHGKKAMAGTVGEIKTKHASVTDTVFGAEEPSLREIYESHFHKSEYA